MTKVQVYEYRCDKKRANRKQTLKYSVTRNLCMSHAYGKHYSFLSIQIRLLVLIIILIFTVIMHGIRVKISERRATSSCGHWLDGFLDPPFIFKLSPFLCDASIRFSIYTYGWVFFSVVRTHTIFIFGLWGWVSKEFRIGIVHDASIFFFHPNMPRKGRIYMVFGKYTHACVHAKHVFKYLYTSNLQRIRRIMIPGM